MVTVLIVDDSAFMRSSLASVLGRDPEIKVIGTAKDGMEALAKIKELNPDVVTLDVEMPRMNGLEALQQIMATMPRPVLMCSSLTAEGAEASLRAMELGALDFVLKDSSLTQGSPEIAQELCHKVRAVARKKALLALRASANVKTVAIPRAPVTSPYAPIWAKGREKIPQGRPSRDIVFIGVSTGGPPAVQKILSRLPANFPASILIAQHMPAAFTGPFAARLDKLCPIHVKEAETGDRPVAGTAYVAPGGQHMRIIQRGAVPEIAISPEPTSELYKPSVNVLMQSAAAFGRRALGVMLTGMGSDGSIGAREFKQRGGFMLAQNEASCVVYGMPRAIVEGKLADYIVDIEDMHEAIMVSLYK